MSKWNDIVCHLDPVTQSSWNCWQVLNIWKSIAVSRASGKNRLALPAVGMIEVLWDLLGKKLCLIFGKECASACIWMVCSLIVRTLLTAFRLEHFVPNGIVFAFPYFIQVRTLEADINYAHLSLYWFATDFALCGSWFRGSFIANPRGCNSSTVQPTFTPFSLFIQSTDTW
jgi:hypothetical protein